MSELDEIIGAIKTGNIETGRTRLMNYLRLHPGDAVAWLWLAEVIDDPAKEQDCRDHALRIKPDIDLDQISQFATGKLPSDMPTVDEILDGPVAELPGGPKGTDVAQSSPPPEMPTVDEILDAPAAELPSGPKGKGATASLPPPRKQPPPIPTQRAGQSCRWKSAVMFTLLAGLACTAITCAVAAGLWLQRGFQPCADLDVAFGRPSGCQYVVETEEWVDSLAFSPDNQYLATGGAKNTVFIRRASDGQVVRSMPMPGQKIGQVTGLAFSPAGNIVAAGGGDTSIRFWQVSDGSLSRSVEKIHNWPLEVAFSPNWKYFVTGSQKQVRLGQVEDGTVLKVYNGHTGDVNAVAYSPDGKTLASGSDDFSVRIWNANESESLHILRGHTDRVRTVAFSPDGTLLASGGEDNEIRLWQVADGQLIRTLRGHGGRTGDGFNLLFTDMTKGVRDLAFSPDGTVLASAGSDGTVRLWRIADGKLLKTLSGHTNVVNKVAFSPDNRLLASGSGDSTIRVWRWR